MPLEEVHMVLGAGLLVPHRYLQAELAASQVPTNQRRLLEHMGLVHLTQRVAFQVREVGH